MDMVSRFQSQYRLASLFSPQTRRVSQIAKFIQLRRKSLGFCFFFVVVVLFLLD